MSMTETLRAFEKDKCKERCLAPIDRFRKEGAVTETSDGIYVHRDNGSSILGIAHLDTVNKPTQFKKTFTRPTWNKFVYQEWHPKKRKKTKRISLPWNKKKPDKKPKELIYLTQGVDDRLGAYILLDLLPKLGIEIDILLTEGEESGRSTSRHFTSDKKYNWMFSFDREGTDVVMYQYRNDESLEKLKKHNLRPSWGSFSDISFMSFMEIVGFNFGTGAHNGHFDHAYFVVNELVSQVTKFCSFFFEYKNEKMTYDMNSLDFQGEWDLGYGGFYSPNQWRGYTEDDYWRDGKGMTAGSTFDKHIPIGAINSSRRYARYAWHKCVCGKSIGIITDGKAECWHCERKWIHSRHTNAIYPLTTYEQMDLDIAKSVEKPDEDRSCFICDGPLASTFLVDGNSLTEKAYVCEWCGSKHTAFVVDGIEELSLVANEYLETCEGCSKNVCVGGLVDTQSDTQVCNDCLRYFTLCDGCKEWFEETGWCYCPQCTKDRARQKVCKFCAKIIVGKVWKQNVGQSNDVKYICSPCIASRFFQCDDCEGMYNKTFARYYLGEEVLCPNCNIKRITNKRKENKK